MCGDFGVMAILIVPLTVILISINLFLDFEIYFPSLYRKVTICFFLFLQFGFFRYYLAS